MIQGLPLSGIARFIPGNEWGNLASPDRLLRMVRTKAV